MVASAIATVQTYEPGPIHMGRIAYGEDITATLEAYCQAQQIKTAWLSLVGAVSEATLAYYEQVGHQYVTRQFVGEFEILNGTGNISLKDGKPFAHIHLTLSGEDFDAFGGHLMRTPCKVFMCEFVLHTVKSGEPLQRIDCDPRIALPIW